MSEYINVVKLSLGGPWVVVVLNSTPPKKIVFSFCFDFCLCDYAETYQDSNGDGSLTVTSSAILSLSDPQPFCIHLFPFQRWSAF